MAKRTVRKTRENRETILPPLEFYQLDIDFDDRRIRYSTWGSTKLAFVGREKVLYFNLNINGLWAVQNAAVLSREGAGKKQETWFSFQLTKRQGRRVSRVEYGYGLAEKPLARAPAVTAEAKVTLRRYRLRQGTKGPRDRPPKIQPKPSTPIKGAPAVGPKAAHQDFPNQECGRNECVPAAVSNSLKFLNKRNDLGIPEKEISIDALKKPTGWRRQDGSPDNWQEGKKNYVESENKKSGKKKYPIETTVPNQPTKYAEKIFDAIRRGCDVEIIANHHCVAVTGAQRLRNGKYSLDLTHDPIQGPPRGDAVTETVTYNPNTNTVLDGAPFIAGEKIRLVVIECVKRPS